MNVGSCFCGEIQTVVGVDTETVFGIEVETVFGINIWNRCLK